MWWASVIECTRRWQQVVFGWHDPEHAQEILIQAPWSIFVHCDATKPAWIQSLIDQCIVDWVCQIDWLFCSIWSHIDGTITQTRPDQWQDMMDYNIMSTYRALHMIIPHMIKQQFWRIVLMWSDQSYIWKPQSSAYGMTKAAIMQLTKSTAIDYAQYDICTNCICPGTIDTRQIQHTTIEQKLDFQNAQPIKRLGTPTEVAKLVAFLLLDNDWFMTWACVPIDGWYTAQ